MPGEQIDVTQERVALSAAVLDAPFRAALLYLLLSLTFLPGAAEIGNWGIDQSKHFEQLSICVCVRRTTESDYLNCKLSCYLVHLQLDASALLWYHALSGDSAREALAAAGLAAICTLILGNSASSPVDQTSVLGALKLSL